MPAGEGLKPAFLEVKSNFIFLASIKDDLFGGGGLYVCVKPQLPWPLSAPRRVGVEKGQPKTASLPPTMPVTDNTLLSGMGGQWSHRRAGGGGWAGERWTKGFIQHSLPPPPLPWAPHKVVVFVPAPGLGGTGHLRRSLALRTPCCVSAAPL